MYKSDRNDVVNELKKKTKLIVMKTELFFKMLKSITQSVHAKFTLSKYKE